MATRHSATNLCRRGEIYHWRARVPAAFRAVAEATHLSLTLSSSDHRLAGYVARRLNGLMHDLRARPQARTMTMEQLETLLRAERDLMRREYEAVQYGAKRVGADPVGEVQADLEMGWAYRLLQRFGSLAKLSFNAQCRGRAYLRQQGVPEASVESVATAYAQAFEVTASQPFQMRLATMLRQFEIDDTDHNREMVTSQLMRARADTLLDTARYPEIPDVTAAEAFAWHEPHQVGPEAEEAAPHAAEPAPQPVSEIISAVVDEAPHRAPVPTNAPVPGVELLVTHFGEVAEQFIQGQKQNWTPKTARDLRAIVRLFVGVLDDNGVTKCSSIAQFHIGELRTFLDIIPRNYGQSSRLRNLSLAELRKHAQALGNAGDPVGLGANTIRKHLANLMRFCDYLRGRGYALAPLTIDGLRPGKPERGADVRTLTQKPAPDQVRLLFEMPVFKGCASANRQDESGEVVFHSANYFVPMLLAYLGTRRGEITGLAVDDIVSTKNGWAIEIRPNKFRRVKKAQSVRTGDRFYRDFVDLAKSHMAGGLWGRTLHALRHGHADTLKQAGVDHAVINDVSGRRGKDETSTRYTNVAHYPNITDGLGPRPLTLLPWVERKELAPWAKSSRDDRLAQANVARAESVRKRRAVVTLKA